MLLEANPDLDAKDGDGKTALACAVAAEHEDAALALIDRGASTMGTYVERFLRAALARARRVALDTQNKYEALHDAGTALRTAMVGQSIGHALPAVHDLYDDMASSVPLNEWLKREAAHLEASPAGQVARVAQQDFELAKRLSPKKSSTQASQRVTDATVGRISV